MHWCQDESVALMATIPVIGIAFRKLHNWVHQKMNHKCHHEGCDSTHTDHVEEVVVSIPSTWREVTIDEVDRQFGDLPTILLMFDRVLLGTIDKYPGEQSAWEMLSGEKDDGTFPTRNEFKFFLSNNTLHGYCRGKFFVWNDTLSWKTHNHQHQSELCKFFEDAARRFENKGI